MRKPAAGMLLILLAGLFALQIPYQKVEAQVSAGVFPIAPGAALKAYGDTWKRGVSGNWLYNQEAPTDTIVLGEIPCLGASRLMWYVWADDSTDGNTAACSTAVVKVTSDGVNWLAPAAGTATDSISTRYIGSNSGGSRRWVIFNAPAANAGSTNMFPWTYARLEVRTYGITPVSSVASINRIKTIYAQRWVIQ